MFGAELSCSVVPALGLVSLCSFHLGPGLHPSASAPSSRAYPSSSLALLSTVLPSAMFSLVDLALPATSCLCSYPHPATPEMLTGPYLPLFLFT